MTNLSWQKCEMCWCNGDKPTSIVKNESRAKFNLKNSDNMSTEILEGKKINKKSSVSEKRKKK